MLLLGVVGGFAWIAVLSFDVIHGDQTRVGISNLEPVEIIGPQQTVFKWKTQACEPRDIPDAPARAYRDADGRVHLLASAHVSRAMVGPDLDHVKHECRVIMRSPLDAQPRLYADREWIASPYTTDGKTVFALIHDEYHGNQHAVGHCFTGTLLECWYNAITLARSDDGGLSFHPAEPPPGQLVAATPYRYKRFAGPFGIFQPSNIVFNSKDGYYYVLMFAKGYRAQEEGSCLMRTNDLAKASSWRAWDGSKFSVSFVNPYVVRVASKSHLCEPVSPDKIGTMTQSLTYNTYFGKYLLVSPAGKYSPRKRRTVWGVYYSLSGDLIHWSEPKLIRETELTWTYRCGDADPVAYPSVLDPKSRSRNFETTGRRPYLYFVRLHYSSCAQTFNRDLVRVPIEFSK
jgi:hypothetical protein